jgi:hypothetical protein
MSTRKRARACAADSIRVEKMERTSDELAEERADKIQERMRGSHSWFLVRSVYSSVGLQPRPLFSADCHDMPGRHSEVSPSCKGNSDVNRSIGFVVRGLWSVKARNDR